MIINMFFINKFYIFEKRQALNEVYKEINNLELDELFNVITDIENKTLTTIVYVEDLGNVDIINDEIINALERKKIKLNKFWITEEVLEQLNYTSVNKIYDQELVKYKFYVKILKRKLYFCDWFSFIKY